MATFDPLDARMAKREARLASQGEEDDRSVTEIKIDLIAEMLTEIHREVVKGSSPNHPRAKLPR